MEKLRSARVEPQVDRRWGDKKIAAPAMRWTGTIHPSDGPAYTGPWATRADAECFDGSVRCSRDDNASVTFRFRGKSILVSGVTGSNHGMADISLDGEPQPRLDCYSSQPRHDATLFSTGQSARRRS